MIPTTNPDQAAAEAERLINSPYGPNVQYEVAVQRAAAQADAILAAMDLPEHRPFRPSLPTPDDGDADRAEREAMEAELLERMEAGDLGREYRHPGYDD